jgi:hypothetical protein
VSEGQAMICDVRDEIQDAIQRLGLADSDIKLLPDEEGSKIYYNALSHFVLSGDRRWWWEDFRFPATTVQVTDQAGFSYIEKIVPNKKEKVWFFAEDDQQPFYPIYEAIPEAVQSVIGECYGFEYYLIAKDFGWLLCENHHDYVIAIGTEVERNLSQLDL